MFELGSVPGQVVVPPSLQRKVQDYVSTHATDTEGKDPTLTEMILRITPQSAKSAFLSVPTQ